jgi:hypothetical protein
MYTLHVSTFQLRHKERTPFHWFLYTYQGIKKKKKKKDSPLYKLLTLLLKCLNQISRNSRSGQKYEASF